MKRNFAFLGTALLLGVVVFAGQVSALPVKGNKPAQSSVIQRKQGGPANQIIKLTPDQTKRMKAIRSGVIAKIKAVQANKSLTPASKNAKIREIAMAGSVQMSQILTPDQRKKLVSLQKQGRMNGGGRIAAQLNLTKDQQAKVQKVMMNARTQIQALETNKSLTADQKKNKMTEIRKSAIAQLNKILTKEQQQKLQSMGPRPNGKH